MVLYSPALASLRLSIRPSATTMPSSSCMRHVLDRELFVSCVARDEATLELTLPVFKSSWNSFLNCMPL